MYQKEKTTRKKWGLAMAALLVVLLSLTGCNVTSSKVKIPDISGTNYCNYAVWNEVDCNGDYLALYSEKLLGTVLTVYDANGKVTAISNAWPSFQLCGPDLFYIKSGSLMKMNLQSKKTTELAQNAESFVVHGNKMYYCTETRWSEASGEAVNQAYQYDLDTKTETLLCRNVSQLFVHQDRLYAVNMEDKLMEITAPGQTQTVLQLDPDAYPYYVLPQGDHLLALDGFNNLLVISRKLGSAECIPIVEGSMANDRTYLICDETQIFVSYHATKTDGSIVKDADSEHNGVWQVFPDTKEVRKVCDTYFESLYLNDGVLLGVTDGKLYCIDAETGAIEKLN